MSQYAQQSTNDGSVPATTITRTFESPSDLLRRIVQAGTPVPPLKGTPSPVPPFPIPVLTTAQYYSLTAAEREDYHLLQQTFTGKVEVPGLAATTPAQGESGPFPSGMEYFSISAHDTPRGRSVELKQEPGSPDSQYDGDSETSETSEETLHGFPPQGAYEEFAKGNPFS